MKLYFYLPGQQYVQNNIHWNKCGQNSEKSREGHAPVFVELNVVVKIYRIHIFLHITTIILLNIAAGIN